MSPFRPLAVLVRVKGAKLGGGEEFQFKLYNATMPMLWPAIQSRKFRDLNKVKKENGLTEKIPDGEHTVIQYTPDKVFRAVVCEKKMTTLTAIFVASSHSKLV